MTENTVHPQPAGALPAPPGTEKRGLRSTILGVYLMVVGASHILVPRPWERLTRMAFTENIRRWTYGIGVAESSLGLLIVNPRTRLLGYAAGGVHVTFLLRRGLAVLRAR